ncbi:hypothetical protein AURDEDRAFT_100837 [Auricularia subglabra TFB-10046 SS5]|nr:hypothetical protein AURDEDRAFT_100837 [Auricularia subglabra TFB-10046 SS5]
MRKEFRAAELEERVPKLQSEDVLRARLLTPDPARYSSARSEMPRSALPDDDAVFYHARHRPGLPPPPPGYLVPHHQGPSRPMTVPPGFAHGHHHPHLPPPPPPPPPAPRLLPGRQPAPLPNPSARTAMQLSPPPPPMMQREQTPAGELLYAGGGGGPAGEQVYSCLVPGCGETFAHPNFLDAHMRMHNCADKRCPCPFPGCGWRFDFPSDVRAHMMVHSGDKPYGCEHPGCGKRYQRQHDLWRHAKDKHGDHNAARRDRV